MLLRVDPAHPLPVYEQVRAQIARMAVSGQLAVESRLPTIRQLAADLGLAKGTVERAYLLLEGDGVVETRGRAGTFVAATRQPGNPTGTDLQDAADQLAVVALQLGVNQQQAAQALEQAFTSLT